MKFFNFLLRHKALVLLTVIIIIAVIVLLQNSDFVNVKILFWQFSAQKVIFIIGAMILGYIIGKLVEVTVRSK
ncbi:MAG: DUF1049 domain-containing protein [Candidatus Aminicenantes bacterium]|nr:DUF1049 domain-containing protein [Candidatus Aminicenantes bacterium]